MRIPTRPEPGSHTRPADYAMWLGGARLRSNSWCSNDTPSTEPGNGMHELPAPAEHSPAQVEINTGHRPDGS